MKENQYYFTMPESDVTVSVEFSYRVLTNPFTDVKTGDWFYDAVSYVYTEGLMTGTGTLHLLAQRPHQPRHAGDHPVAPAGRAVRQRQQLQRRQEQRVLLRRGALGRALRHSRGL